MTKFINWTSYREKYIRANYDKISDRRIAKHLKVSGDAVRRYRIKHNLIRKQRITPVQKNTETAKEVAYIKANYKKVPCKTMANTLKRSDVFVRGVMQRHNLVRPREITEKFIVESRFQKGLIPANKGKKWNEYMSKEGQRRAMKTTFKKGQKVWNYHPVGTIQLRGPLAGRSRGGRPRYSYYWIKVKDPNIWKEVHVYLYELKHGPVPKGYNVVFKNGNTLHCTEDNLECISNAELMKRNTIHRLPKEHKETLILINSLKRQIKKHEHK